MLRYYFALFTFPLFSSNLYKLFICLSATECFKVQLLQSFRTTVRTTFRFLSRKLSQSFFFTAVVCKILHILVLLLYFKRGKELFLIYYSYVFKIERYIK